MIMADRGDVYVLGPEAPQAQPCWSNSMSSTIASLHFDHDPLALVNAMSCFPKTFTFRKNIPLIQPRAAQQMLQFCITFTTFLQLAQHSKKS